MPLTPTTRLGLVKPDPNPTTGDFVDVTVVNGNMDKVDSVISATPCTSAARPGTPFGGQMAYETDTLRTIVRNSAASRWDPVSGCFSCTSGTRPGTPYEGMLIRETDTRRVLVWNNTQSAWDVVTDPGAWTAYTPSWTAATTNPTLGNGTVVGRSRTIGKTMELFIKLTWGSTTSAASTGSWRFTIPAAVQADQLMSVYVDDNSASARWPGQARMLGAINGDNMRIVVTAGGGALGGATTPMTWATGDLLIMQGVLELA